MKKPTKPSICTLLLQSFWRGQDGFSLAEVMVAAGMLGVLSLGVTQLMQSSKKTEKRLGQQVNIISIDGEIREALRNPVGCGRTLRSASSNVAGNPTTDMSVADWTNVPDRVIYRSNLQNLLSDQSARWGIVAQEWQSAGSNIGVYGDGSNQVTVQSIQYRGFYTGTDNSYTVAGNYANPGVDPTSMSAIAGTTEAIGTVVIRVIFTRGNYARFDGLTPDEQQALSNNLTTGPFRLVRFYPVRVRVSAGEPQELIRCLTNNDDILTQYCSAIGGYMDETDGRCKNIKISDTPAAAGAPLGPNQDEDNNYAIAAQRTAGDAGAGKIIAESGLVVGYDDDPNVGTDLYIFNMTYNATTGDKIGWATGERIDFDPVNLPDRSIMVERDIISDQDIYAHRSLNVGIPHNPTLSPAPPLRATGYGDASFGRDILVGRNATINRGLNVGAPSSPVGTGIANVGNAAFSNDVRVEGALNVGGAGAITTPETVDGRILVRNKITLAQATADTTGGSALHVGSGTNHFVNGTRDVRINNAGYLSFNLSGDEKGRFATDGSYLIFDGITDEQVTRVGVAEGGTSTGDGTGEYRPIRIYNQSTATSTMTFTNGSAAAVEVPTKQWVRRMVFGTLESNPGLISSVVNDITSYAQHNSIDAIRSAACTSLRLTTHSYTSTCTWNSTLLTCTCQNSNCGRAAASPDGVQICNNINVPGTITANTAVVSNRFYTAGQAAPPAGYMRAGFIQAMGATADIYSQNNIRAQNNISTLAGNITSANSVIAQNRVCAQGNGGIYYCFTKFGKHACNNGGFMIGIAYGHPICATSGPNGPSSAPARF